MIPKPGAPPARLSVRYDCGDFPDPMDAGMTDTAGPATDADGRPVAEPAALPDLREYPVRFTGEPKEYLKIWLTNIGLSAVTLGIYSAWAKVRKKRYLMGNTVIDGFGFDYHASPVSILAARIVFLVALGLLQFLGPVGTGLAAVLLVPWLFERKLSFESRNSSYRTIRFGFRGKLPAIYGIFVPLYAMSGFLLLEHLGPLHWLILALALLFPVAWSFWALHRYSVANRTLGSVRLGHSSGHGPYIVAIVVVPFCWFIVFATVYAATEELVAATWPGALALILLALFTYLCLAVGGATLKKALLNSVRVGDGRVSCDLSPLRYGATVVGTGLLALVTLGALWPWAVIVRARLLAGATTVHCAPELMESIVAQAEAGKSAIGQEGFDILGIDLGSI